MTNRDLLKEAIADAKSVKETAIANAKAALEESFTPHLKSMLAAKLEEMYKEDESIDESEEIQETEEVVNETEEVEENVNIEEEIDIDELLAEIEEGEGEEEVNESEEIEESEEVTEAEEDETEEVEDEEAEEATDEEEIDLEDMTEDDLKSFIEDVIKDMVDAGELEAGEEMEDEMEADADMEDDMEIEVEDEEDEIMEDDAVSKKLKDGASLDSAPRKVGQTTVQEGEEDIDEGYGDMADSAGGGLENIVNAFKKVLAQAGPMAEKAKEELKKLAQAAHAVREDEIEETSELAELEELKAELNEVNLLNAKLLYTNKIFKAKNLSEDKKVKVLKAFDKAETVKEAKVIFETLNEGIVSKGTTSMVNEVKGSASKAMGISQTVKQPIVESDAFARMQKLAGIIK